MFVNLSLLDQARSLEISGSEDTFFDRRWDRILISCVLCWDYQRTPHGSIKAVQGLISDLLVWSPSSGSPFLMLLGTVA